MKLRAQSEAGEADRNSGAWACVPYFIVKAASEHIIATLTPTLSIVTYGVSIFSEESIRNYEF
jgi:hypothetical protein